MRNHAIWDESEGAKDGQGSEHSLVPPQPKFGNQSVQAVIIVGWIPMMMVVMSVGVFD